MHPSSPATIPLLWGRGVRAFMAFAPRRSEEAIGEGLKRVPTQDVLPSDGFSAHSTPSRTSEQGQGSRSLSAHTAIMAPSRWLALGRRCAGVIA